MECFSLGRTSLDYIGLLCSLTPDLIDTGCYSGTSLFLLVSLLVAYFFSCNNSSSSVDQQGYTIFAKDCDGNLNMNNVTWDKNAVTS